MNASRSPEPSRENSVRKLASEPPLVIDTSSGEAPGYQAAMLARVSSEPSESG